MTEGSNEHSEDRAFVTRKEALVRGGAAAASLGALWATGGSLFGPGVANAANRSASAAAGGAGSGLPYTRLNQLRPFRFSKAVGASRTCRNAFLRKRVDCVAVHRTRAGHAEGMRASRPLLCRRQRQRQQCDQRPASPRVPPARNGGCPAGAAGHRRAEHCQPRRHKSGAAPSTSSRARAPRSRMPTNTRSARRTQRRLWRGSSSTWAAKRWWPT